MSGKSAEGKVAGYYLDGRFCALAGSYISLPQLQCAKGQIPYIAGVQCTSGLPKLMLRPELVP